MALMRLWPYWFVASSEMCGMSLLTRPFWKIELVEGVAIAVVRTVTVGKEVVARRMARSDGRARMDS